MVTFIDQWSAKTGIAERKLLGWLGLAASTYHHWRARRGQANRHNALQPRHFRLLP